MRSACESAVVISDLPRQRARRLASPPAELQEPRGHEKSDRPASRKRLSLSVESVVGLQVSKKGSPVPRICSVLPCNRPKSGAACLLGLVRTSAKPLSTTRVVDRSDFRVGRGSCRSWGLSVSPHPIRRRLEHADHALALRWCSHMVSLQVGVRMVSLGRCTRLTCGVAAWFG